MPTRNAISRVIEGLALAPSADHGFVRATRTLLGGKGARSQLTLSEPRKFQMMLASTQAQKLGIRSEPTTRWIMNRPRNYRSSPDTHQHKTIFWLLLILNALTPFLVGCARQNMLAETPLAKQAPRNLAGTGRVSFVQITDPHLFDAGEKLHGERIDAEALDNRAAFHWAILTINRLELAEKAPIDFVVITGDFGLWNVTLPERDGLATRKCECPKRTPGNEGPISAVSLHEAATETARELDALVVRNIFLVPGNNDLCAESPLDLHRWAEFVFELNQALKERESQRGSDLAAAQASPSVPVFARKAPLVIDLTYTLERLYAQGDPRIRALYTSGNGPGKPPVPPMFSGISLLGLNSAYFKPHPARPDGRNPLQEASDRASEQEFQFVSDRIVAGKSYLLFTHVPDVEDPYRGSGSTIVKQPRGNLLGSLITAPGVNDARQAAPLDPGSSWKLTSRGRAVWRERILTRSELLAVFAGHFHSSNRSLYPHNFTSLHTQPDEMVASKLWIAPPLAAKYQEFITPTKTARGLLLIHVTTDGGIRVSSKADEVVEPEPVWFSTLDQGAAVEGDSEITAARAYELDGKWDLAADKYASAFRSSDSRVRATATSGYVRDRAITRTWWWETGYYFPPIRWLFVHPRRIELALPVLLLLLLVVRLLRQFKVFSLLGLLFKFLIVPPFRGKAIINTPVAITKDAPADEFGAQIQAATEEIRQRLLREQENWAARQIALLSPSSASLDQVVGSIPDIQKVNVASWLKFVFKLMQLFRWSVDCGLAVFVEPSQAPASPRRGQLSGYAVLQWSFFIKNSWRQNVAMEKPTSQVDLARSLAALILGEAFARRRW